MNDVTVIIPTYNRDGLLIECLKTIFDQTVSPCEVIVVDDGSTDGTAGRVACFGDRVRYLRQENAGKAVALNHALRHASGAAIWIFDDDDLADRRALEHLSAALAHDPDAGFAFGRHDVFDSDSRGARRHVIRPFPKNAESDLHFQLLNNCFCFQGAMLVRRACYAAVGPFDATLSRAQDYDMMIRLSAAYPARFVDRIVFHQRQHGGTRGPSHDRIEASRLAERQLHFDGLVLKKAYDADPLDRYLPRTVAADTPSRRFQAMLRRASVMGRRRWWDEAARDLTVAAGLARSAGIRQLDREQRALLGRIFDRSPDLPELLANPVIREALAVPETRLRRQVLAALGLPFLFAGVKSAARLRPTQAMRAVACYLTLTRARALPRHAIDVAQWVLAVARNRHRLLPEP